MPVTLNPPPFPTPDNTKVASADKTGDANDASPDSSQRTFLHAAGSSAAKRAQPLAAEPHLGAAAPPYRVNCCRPTVSRTDCMARRRYSPCLS